MKAKALPNPYSESKESAPKAVEHVRIYPAMGGGVRVEQHHVGYSHQPSVKTFKPSEKAKAKAHIMKASGMEGCEE